MVEILGEFSYWVLAIVAFLYSTGVCAQAVQQGMLGFSFEYFY